MNKKIFIKGILIPIWITLSIFPLIGNATQEVWNLKDECVGRFQLNIPFDADVATYPLSRIKNEIQNPGGQQIFQFDDGEEAASMSLEYARQLFISSQLTRNEIDNLKSTFLQQRKILQKRFAESLSKKDREISVATLHLEQDNVQAWSVADGITALINVENVVLLARFTAQDNLTSNKEDLEKFARNFKSRKMFTLPRESGVCIPFSFINDSVDNPRRISTTFRMRSHPDITISLEETVIDVAPDPKESENSDIKKEMNHFWSQYRNIDKGESIKSEWILPATRSVSLAGHNGEASFVKIVRKDKHVDFGYLAITKLNQGNKQKSLRLLLIQNSEYSRPKQIPPLEKNDIYRLAETIARSVKIRN